MLEMLSLLAYAGPAYSLSHALFRHAVFEDSGALDSLATVALHCLPLAVLQLPFFGALQLPIAILLSMGLAVNTYSTHVAGMYDKHASLFRMNRTNSSLHCTSLQH